MRGRSAWPVGEDSPQASLNAPSTTCPWLRESFSPGSDRRSGRRRSKSARRFTGSSSRDLQRRQRRFAKTLAGAGSRISISWHGNGWPVPASKPCTAGISAPSPMSASTLSVAKACADGWRASSGWSRASNVSTGFTRRQARGPARTMYLWSRCHLTKTHQHTSARGSRISFRGWPRCRTGPRRLFFTALSSSFSQAC